jgi:hypothetical protein
MPRPDCVSAVGLFVEVIAERGMTILHNTIMGDMLAVTSAT